ncbi:N-6 DNA methylase, partial [Vreelandella aquamarina]
SYLLPLWRSYSGPAQGANSTPNVEEPKNVNKFVEIYGVPSYKKSLGAPHKDDLVEPGNLIQDFYSMHDYIYANSNIKKPDRITTNILNIIFCKLSDELSADEYCDFYVRYSRNDEVEEKKTGDAIKRIFSKVKSDYSDIFYDSDHIEFDNKTLCEIVTRLQKYAFINSRSDNVANAFEVFTSESLKEDNGQFFTPRNVVNFAVDIVDPQPGQRMIDHSLWVWWFYYLGFTPYKSSFGQHFG